jgi:transposase InsO family protein
MTQPQGELGIERLCELARVSRASYYRHWQRAAPAEADVELRDRIQRICLAHRFYGYRRVGAVLRKQGLTVNHKKLRRLMREDNLLAVRKKKFIATTDSRHYLSVFPNLAVCFDPQGANELWVADLTYIRLRGEFVYLAVVLDLYSRRVVGWALARSLQAALPAQALERAVAERQPAPGLIHHSDRGVQYASQEYIALLEKYAMIGSMSKPGYPYDNAHCESFLKTLKQEEIDCRQYTNLEDLSAHLAEFIGTYYNQQRLHSALGYQSPEEFERSSAA